MAKQDAVAQARGYLDRVKKYTNNFVSKPLTANRVSTPIQLTAKRGSGDIRPIVRSVNVPFERLSQQSPELLRAAGTGNNVKRFAKGFVHALPRVSSSLPGAKIREGFIEGSSAGLTDVPNFQPVGMRKSGELITKDIGSRNLAEKLQYGTGYAVGAFGPMSILPKLFSTLNTAGAKPTAALISKFAPQTGTMARTLSQALAGEAAQTAGYFGLQQAGRKLGLNKADKLSKENLASSYITGLGLRGAFAGAGLHGMIKNPKAEDTDMLDRAVDILRQKKKFSPKEINQARDTIYKLSEGYIPKKELPESGNINVLIRKLQKVFKEAPNQYGVRNLPGLGFVDDASGIKGADKPFRFSMPEVDDFNKAYPVYSGSGYNPDMTKAQADEVIAKLFNKAYPGVTPPQNPKTVLTSLQKIVNRGGLGMGDNPVGIAPSATKDSISAMNKAYKEGNIQLGDQIKRAIAEKKPSIEAGLEKATGWAQGDKVKFDTALFKKDAKTIEEMLPKVPEEYKQRFSKEISLLVQKKQIADKVSQGLTPQMKAGITAQNQAQQFTKQQIENASGKQFGMSTADVGDALHGGYSKETANYLKELKHLQQGAKGGARGPVIESIKSNTAEGKTGFVDEYSAIEDALSRAEKTHGYQVLPKYDVRRYGIDRVLKSNELASQFVKDNKLYDVIKNIDNTDEFNQYLIAKQASDVAGQGKITGRNLIKDKKLIEELGPKYEQQAKVINQYTKQLKQYLVDSGLISEKLSKTLDKKYPNYVPLNRIFTELEKSDYGVSNKQVASLGKQTIIQKLTGSEREIANPLESLLTKTSDAFAQGERNKTASMLAKYRTLPGFEDLIKEANTGSKHTFSYLDGGVKKTFETTPEIAAAAKSLNREQMSLILKLVSPFTRALNVGATGINIPFLVTNIARDEMTGFINSNRAAKTSILNPINFTKSLFSAIKHDDLYDEVVRNAGMQTSFDIARSAPELTVNAIRSNRNLKSKILYTATSPERFIRAVENIVGRGEELGRIKNYSGMKEALLKEGRTLQDAQILAAQAAREYTANFARKGTWGRTLNYIIPFFNAGIQGARQLVRSFQNNPKDTATKMAIGVFTPIAAATAWNLSDEQRKKVYEDISDYEKQANILIIPPNPTQDESGKWNVIKIPLPPGISNLGTVVRRNIEQAHGLDPVKFKEVAANIITAGTSIDVTSPTRALSSFFPQALKIPAELQLNRNFYTGRDIVPYYMKDKLPEEQVFKNTSGTARAIGKITNTSPLKIENAVRTGLGGLGNQLINASDRVLHAAGKIPEEQIGGEGALANLKRRFSQSYGGEIKREAESKVREVNVLKKEAIESYILGDTQKTKDIITKNKLQITKGDVKKQINSLKNKAVEAYIEGDIESSKKLVNKYKLQITKGDVKKKAKSKAISFYKKYKDTQDEYYLSQVKELVEKYKLQITNSDVQ